MVDDFNSFDFFQIELMDVLHCSFDCVQKIGRVTIRWRLFTCSLLGEEEPEK